MEKLRKYIQECWGDIVYSDYNKVATLEDLEYNYRYIRFILSPEAMFIKWLIDNDKIDFDKCWYCYEINSTYDHYNLEDSQDLWLIMLLSISSSPIQDLVSYLK